MDWKALGERLARAGLPAVGGALGGPAGAAVGVELARRIGSGEDTPEAVMQALSSDPDAYAAADQYEVELAEQETERLKAQLADTQHARETHRGHWMPAVLTLALVLMFAALTGALFFFEIPAANQRAADIVLGAMLGAFGTAVAYWLGSSRGSAEKQEILARQK